MPARYINKLSNKFTQLLFFSLIISPVFFSGLMYDTFQLAKASAFIFFLVLLLFCAVFFNSRAKITPAFFAYILFFSWLISGVLKSPLSPQFYYTLTLCSAAAFIAPLFLK